MFKLFAAKSELHFRFAVRFQAFFNRYFLFCVAIGEYLFYFMVGVDCGVCIFGSFTLVVPVLPLL